MFIIVSAVVLCEKFRSIQRSRESNACTQTPYSSSEGIVGVYMFAIQHISLQLYKCQCPVALADIFAFRVKTFVCVSVTHAIGKRTCTYIVCLHCINAWGF